MMWSTREAAMENMGNQRAVRRAAVAGRFYPGHSETLDAEVRDLLAAAGSGERPVLAAMAPHAGYVFSGGVAAEVFAAARIPERVVILAPNHTGAGPRISIFDGRAYEMPWGEVPIDAALVAALVDEIPGAETDGRAHAGEHAIEVELPFLHARQPALSIAPIVVGPLSADDAVELGRGLHRAIERCGGPAEILVVASSDMNHFAPDRETREIDRLALAPLLDADPRGLYRTVRDNRISMCGFIPATAMLVYAGEVGARAPELLRYATSGDAFGDRDRVVGYAGVVIEPG
jgi:hypothetical protein